MQMRGLASFFLVVVILYSCNSRIESTQSIHADTVQTVGSDTSLGTDDPVTTGHGTAKFGDRFSIVGDFDGDGMEDTIYESFVSQLTNLEMPKEFDVDDWGRNVKLIMEHKPLTRLYSSIAAVDTFTVTDQRQQCGVYFFRTLGNLDGESGDEFGYAVNNADQSNLNTYHVMTFKDHRFVEVLRFDINEMVSWDTENLFDNGFFIKSISGKRIVYKFYSDSATVEQAIYSFR